MAIESYRGKQNITYKAIIRLPNGKKFTKTFLRKSDAKAWEGKQLNNRRLGNIIQHQKITFDEATERWVTLHADLKKTASCVYRDKHLLRSYLLPFFGNKDIKEITLNDVDMFIGQLRRKTQLKPASINKQLQLLKAIINFCYKRRLIPFNPIAGASLLPIEQQPFDYWSKEEVDQFLSYTKKKYEGTDRQWIYLFYLIALNTGMRLGEILGLSWRHVNLKERHTTICRIRENVTGLIVERTKGKKIRHIGINDTLFGALVSAKNISKENQDLIFLSPQGNPVDPDDFRRHYWEKDIKQAGVRRIRIHDMRHTFASHFMMNGGSLYDLQAILGHASIRMTERYAHLAPQHLQSKANLVQFGGASLEEKAAVIELMRAK